MSGKIDYLQTFLGVTKLSVGGLVNVMLVVLSSLLLVSLPILYDYGVAKMPLWLTINHFTASFGLFSLFSFLGWIWILIRGLEKRGVTSKEEDVKLIEEIEKEIEIEKKEGVS